MALQEHAQQPAHIADPEMPRPVGLPSSPVTTGQVLPQRDHGREDPVQLSTQLLSVLDERT